MKKSVFLILCWVLFIIPAGTAIADPVKFDLNFQYSDDGTNPAGPPPWLTATFVDVRGEPGSNFNTVQLTMNAGGLTAKEFVESWSFNIVFSDLLSINSGGGTGPEATNDLTVVQGKYKEGPAFGFDIQFEFPTGNSSDQRFGADEFVVYYFSGKGLTASAFNFQNTDGKGPFYSAAHIQSIGANGSGSGFIGTGGEVAPVPEPATMLLFGMGLSGFGLWVRRRSAH